MLMRMLRRAALMMIVGLEACSGGGHGQGSVALNSADVLPAVASIPALPLTDSNVASTPNSAMPAPPSIPQVSTTSSVPVPVTVNYVLPGGTKTQRYNARALHAFRRAQYISTSNTSITVTVTPLGGSPTTYGPTSCTTISCTVSFTAAPGATTLAFTLTDGSSNVLSRYSTVSIIQPTTINTLSFTASPVVSSVSLSLASPSVNAGTATNDLLTVNASDADGNTIIGNSGYVDVNGNSVSIILSVTNAQAGGRGIVNILGPTRITAPGQGAIYAHYDGNWLNYSTITASATSSAVTTSSAIATLTTVPTATEYTCTGLHEIGTVGPDGNIWGGKSVIQITPRGLCTPYAAGAGAQQITTGPDGNLWYVTYGTAKLAKISPLGSGATTYSPGGTAYADIAVGPDANLWFTVSGSNSVKVASVSGTLLQTIALTGNQPIGIGKGPDGNMWVSYAGSSKITKISSAGKTQDYVYADLGSSFWNPQLCFPSDGNIWFASQSGAYIMRSTTTGTITQFSVGVTNISGCAVGVDGNVWVAGSNGISRVTLGGVGTAYGTANGITSSSNVRTLLKGPDGNIWYTYEGGNIVGKFVF